MTNIFEKDPFPHKLLTFLVSFLLALVMVFLFIQITKAQDTPSDPWTDQEWIGKYVMISPVQETERGPTGTLMGTGNELPNTMNFLTLKTIGKERGVFVRLAGREDPKNKIYVGKFNEHCTPDGFKLAIALQQLKVPISGVEYHGIVNFIITWEAVQITWRSQFTWGQVEPLLKKAFIESGYGSPE